MIDAVTSSFIVSASCESLVWEEPPLPLCLFIASGGGRFLYNLPFFRAINRQRGDNLPPILTQRTKTMTNAETAQHFASLPPEDEAQIILVNRHQNDVELLVVSSPEVCERFVEQGLMNEDDDRYPVAFA